MGADENDGQESKIIDSPTHELINQLLDNVETLEKIFKVGLPTPSEIRSTFSPILRKWICHDDLHKVLRHLRGLKLDFMVYKSVGILELCRDKKISKFLERCRLVRTGIAYCVPYLEAEQSDPALNERIIRSAAQQKSAVRAKKFFEQSVTFWEGKMFSRMDVVKFFCNTQGGAHYDLSTVETETLLGVRDYIAFDCNQKKPMADILMQPDLASVKIDRSRRPFIYDSLQVVVADTSQTFMTTIRESRDLIEGLLR